MPSFTIKTLEGGRTFEIAPACSLVFLGANGAGKTRLGVAIEEQISRSLSPAHRVSAQRSIVMNAKQLPPSLDEAEKTLFYGRASADANHTHTQLFRWKQKPATHPLDDFSALLGALYAEETNTSIAYRHASLASKKRVQPTRTKLDRLKDLWDATLPHRELIILHHDIQVRPAQADKPYSASDLSDGERLIFYMIGQCLMVKPGTIIIIDEPELHLNRSIIGNLWDRIEAERNDCGFIYITHDIDFVNSRQSAEKHFVASIDFDAGPSWDIRPLPVGSGIPDDVMGIIVGSRKPILFVEGESSSLDASLYRRIYSNHTIIPLGSCDAVLHAVASFRTNAELHHLSCSGIVDLDGRVPAQVRALDKKGVQTLPVAEVENLLLIPAVFREMAKTFHFSGPELEDKLSTLEATVCDLAAAEAKSSALRFAKRQVDLAIKSVDLKGKEASVVQGELHSALASIDVSKIAGDREREIEAAISARQTQKLLQLVDKKGMLSEAAKILGAENRRRLEEYVGRTLSSAQGEALRLELLKVLPAL